jgi:polyisoprenoid-binding protein YceI
MRVILIISLLSLLSCTKEKKLEPIDRNKQMREKPIPQSPKGLVVKKSTRKHCIYRYQPFHTKIKWRGFKTHEKLAVGGEFKKFTIERKKQFSTQLIDIVKGAKVSIDSVTVDSANPERDDRLRRLFFQNWEFGTSIELFVKKVNVESSQIYVDLKMNNVTREIKFEYVQEGNFLRMFSTIDVLFWNMNKSLDALHNACKDLHNGKTWSQVEIELESHFMCG